MKFKKKNFGGIMLDLILAVGLMNFVIYEYIKITTIKQNQQKARQLAGASLYYAKIFGHYLHDIQSEKLYSMTGNGNECVLFNPFSTNNTQIFNPNSLSGDFGWKIEKNQYGYICNPTDGSYMSSELKSTNQYNQKPCLGATKLSDGSISAFLYWVADSKSSATPLEIARLASIYLEGKGGYLSSDGTITGNGGWSINVKDPRFADPAICSGEKIAENSLVINLDQFVEYKTLEQTWLQRESDEKYQVGDPNNKNTVRSDIYVGKNNIYFDQDKDVKLQLKDDGDIQVDTPNSLVAPSFQPLETHASGEKCTAEEVGKQAKQYDPGFVQYGIQQSGIVCSDSELICYLYGSRYCWLPVKGQKVQFKDTNHTGSLGSRFVCPAFAHF
jgi:hypothetical protein